MLTSGEVVDLELGTLQGKEAGFLHPAVLDGELLAGCLQPELGDSCVVEYYPMPVRPIGGFGSSSERR